MSIFNKILVSLLIIFVLVVVPVVALAENEDYQTTEDVQVWLLPDSPFYFLKTWGEKIRETFTLRTEAKLQYMESLGVKRTAEAQKMMEKGKTDIAEKILARYNERLQKMEQLVANKGEKLDQKIESIQQRISDRFTNRNENLQRVLDKAPEAARPGLQRALQNTDDQLQKLDNRFKEKIEQRDRKNQQLRLRLENTNLNANQ